MDAHLQYHGSRKIHPDGNHPCKSESPCSPNGKLNLCAPSSKSEKGRVSVAGIRGRTDSSRIDITVKNRDP